MTNTPETVTPLATDWQFSVYSLPHVAQPIAPEDPIYGSTWAENEEDVYLGQLDALGEKGMLIAASESMVRLRYNPCFEYPEKAHPGLDRRRRKRIYLKRGVAGSANQK